MQSAVIRSLFTFPRYAYIQKFSTTHPQVDANVHIRSYNNGEGLGSTLQNGYTYQLGERESTTMYYDRKMKELSRGGITIKNGVRPEILNAYRSNNNLHATGNAGMIPEESGYLSTWKIVLHKPLRMLTSYSYYLFAPLINIFRKLRFF